MLFDIFISCICFDNKFLHQNVYSLNCNIIKNAYVLALEYEVLRIVLLDGIYNSIIKCTTYLMIPMKLNIFS